MMMVRMIVMVMGWYHNRKKRGEKKMGQNLNLIIFLFIIDGVLAIMIFDDESNGRFVNLNLSQKISMIFPLLQFRPEII